MSTRLRYHYASYIDPDQCNSEEVVSDFDRYVDNGILLGYIFVHTKDLPLSGDDTYDHYMQAAQIFVRFNQPQNPQLILAQSDEWLLQVDYAHGWFPVVGGETAFLDSLQHWQVGETHFIEKGGVFVDQNSINEYQLDASDNTLSDSENDDDCH